MKYLVKQVATVHSGETEAVYITFYAVIEATNEEAAREQIVLQRGPGFSTALASVAELPKKLTDVQLSKLMPLDQVVSSIAPAY